MEQYKIIHSTNNVWVGRIVNYLPGSGEGYVDGVRFVINKIIPTSDYFIVDFTNMIAWMVPLEE